MNEDVVLALLSVGLIALGFWLTRTPAKPDVSWQEIERVQAGHAYVSAVTAYITSSMLNQGKVQLAPDAAGLLAAMETSLGRVSITRNALVFENASLPWKEVSFVDVLPYSFIVHTRSGGPIRLDFTEHNLEFAKVMVTQANL